MSNHEVNVLRIKQILPHGNADKLEIVPIEGYQAVVGKGQFKVGDLAYYVPPDSIVPDRPEFAFLWGNATFEGGTPVKKRRITAKKLRGEWSEGVLMPLPVDILARTGKWVINEGDDLAEDLGIIHYDPPEPGEDTFRIPTGGNGKKGMPKSIMGWYNLIRSWFRGERREGQGPEGVPVYDVDAFKRYSKTFKDGEDVRVTEKIHGSNARYTYRTGFFGKGKMFAGSRNLWKALGSSCAWRRALKDNPWIETWCTEHPGYTLYGEITPTQKGYDYGSGTSVRFFLFDIRTPDGKWVEMDTDIWTALLEYAVPVLYRGPFDLEHIKTFVDGPSKVQGAKHIREGIVIKAVPERVERGVGRAQLKIVSNNFLSKETA